MSDTDESSGIPQWAKEPLNRAVDQLEQIQQVLHLSTRGMTMLRATPRVVEVLVKQGQSERESLEAARYEAELAGREVENDFPVVHGQALIALVAMFEAFVKDFAAAWMRNRQEVLVHEDIAKLRFKLGDYLPLADDERLEYIAERLDENLPPSLRGVSRVEAFLSPLGLSGEVADETRKTIFELHNVRNVLVHRKGEADRRFVDACPWMGYEIGDDIRVTHTDFERYITAQHDYLEEIIHRVREVFGLHRSPPKESDPT